MSEDTTIYTATMAKIYAGQGHFEKAAGIYRHLLDHSPGNAELKAALAGVEEKMTHSRQHRNDRLAELLQQWFSLMNVCNTQRKLTRYKDLSG